MRSEHSSQARTVLQWGRIERHAYMLLGVRTIYKIKLKQARNLFLASNAEGLDCHMSFSI